MEGASTSRGPSKPNRNVIINAQKLFGVLHEDSILPQDKLKLITELLKVVDVDINFPDGYDKRNTLLHGAVSYGYADLVKLLLQNGAAVNITNAEGETPFHIAVAYGNVYMVRLILHAKKPDVSQQKVDVNVQKVDVNIQNAKGETPLHLVLSDRKINKNKSGIPIVQMLLGCKADVNIKNSDGKTLLDLAKEKKDETIIALLGCRKNNSSLVEVQPHQDNNITRDKESIAEATVRENKVQKVTDAFASLPKAYSSSGAKFSMHGTVYQLCLLMLFAIRALVKGCRFHLGTEVDEAEQFDDLVFKYQLPTTDSIKNLLLQAKSKANEEKGISLEALLDEDNKAQFSLLKYYKSFIKIRESKGLEADHFDFAICTNTHFNFSEPGVLIGNGKKLSFYLVTDICEGFLKEGQCYKLVIDEVTLDWLKIDFAKKLNNGKTKFPDKKQEYDDILSCLNDTHSVIRGTFRTFLNNLVFVVGQAADIELVKTEFKKYSKINHLDTTLHTDAFYKQIFDWFSQKEGVWLTNEMVEEMIGSICDNAFATSLSQVYVEMSRTSNIKFNIYKLNKLNELLSGNQIVNLITPVETKLTLLHVAQALEFSPAYKAHGFIFIHFSSLLLSETQERTIRAFESSRNNNLLVIDCLSDKKDTSSGNLTTLKEKLCDISTNTLKKVLLISPENHELAEMFRTWPGYYSQHVKHVFDDFTKETQDAFLATKVTFQGQHIELNQIIGETEIELFDVPLETLIGEEGLVIGKELPTPDGYNESYYIDRSVRYKTVIKASIFEAKSREMFNDEIANSELEFQQLCSTHPNSNIHLIEKEGDTFIWVKSQGNITALRSYFDNGNTKCCSEELFFDLVKLQQVVIISDSAGMGKSTILTHISKIIQTERQGTLVLRIDLNNHTKTLAKRSSMKVDNLSMRDILLEFLIITSPLEKALLKRNGKTVWLFDAFDEICPDYSETVLDFIRYLLETSDAQIWITTRPNMSAELEKQLHQFSYSLEAFSKPNQIDFLTKYWKQMKNYIQNLEGDRIAIFAETVINKFSASISDKDREFTGIPLQMRMLAECFDDDLENSPERETCLNLVDLYDTFIKKKFEIFHIEKNKTDDSTVGAKQKREKYFKIFEEYHRWIALTVIFPESTVNLFQPTSKEDNNSDTLTNPDRFGIVNIINGEPRFIHRTFAEYLLAVYFLELLKKHEELTIKQQDFIFSELLISKTFMVIRAFLNGLLAKDEPITMTFKNSIGILRDIVYSMKYNSLKQGILLTAEEGNNQIFLYLSNYIQAHPTILRKLLQFRKQCPDAQENTTMLHNAIEHKDTVYIEALLQCTHDDLHQGQKIVKQMLVNSVDLGGGNALIKALRAGHNEVVDTLLQWTRYKMDQGQEVVKLMLFGEDISGGVALILPSWGRNHAELVRKLIRWTRDNMEQGEDLVEEMLRLADDGTAHITAAIFG